MTGGATFWWSSRALALDAQCESSTIPIAFIRVPDPVISGLCPAPGRSSIAPRRTSTRWSNASRPSPADSKRARAGRRRDHQLSPSRRLHRNGGISTGTFRIETFIAASLTGMGRFIVSLSTMMRPSTVGAMAPWFDRLTLKALRSTLASLVAPMGKGYLGGAGQKATQSRCPDFASPLMAAPGR